MKPLATVLAVCIACPALEAASVTVSWSTDRQVHHYPGAPPLSAGTESSGDGARLELGYFALATADSPFAGRWVVLAVGSVGDDGQLADGFFAITTVFESGTFTEPAVGTPLGVRFFDGDSVASSTAYNTVVNVDGTGLWLPPSDPTQDISLVFSKASSEYEDPRHPFTTSIPVPEPRPHALTLAAALVLTLRRPGRRAPAITGRARRPGGRTPGHRTG